VKRRVPAEFPRRHGRRAEAVSKAGRLGRWRIRIHASTVM